MRDLAGKLGNSLTDLQKFFQGQPNITAVYVFGSFGTEYEHPFSDIDFGLIVNTENLTLRDEMSIEALLCSILNRDSVDLVNLNKAPLKIQYRAISEGYLIYEGNYEHHSSFLERVYKRYLDYLPDLNVYEREYEKALKEAYSNRG